MPWLKQKKDGSLVLSLHVQPGTAKSKIIGMYGERLKIAVSAPPVDGKANQEIEKFLAKKLGCAVRNVAVVVGHNSRQKGVEIQGCEEADIRKMLHS